MVWCFFFQAEDGIRDAQESRGLGDVYKRQMSNSTAAGRGSVLTPWARGSVRRCSCSSAGRWGGARRGTRGRGCLLYTSDAADDLLCVDLGGRRTIKKKKNKKKNKQQTLILYSLTTPVHI